METVLTAVAQPAATVLVGVISAIVTLWVARMANKAKLEEARQQLREAQSDLTKLKTEYGGMIETLTEALQAIIDSVQGALAIVERQYELPQDSVGSFIKALPITLWHRITDSGLFAALVRGPHFRADSESRTRVQSPSSGRSTDVAPLGTGSKGFGWPSVPQAVPDMAIERQRAAMRLQYVAPDYAQGEPRQTYQVQPQHVSGLSDTASYRSRLSVQAQHVSGLSDTASYRSRLSVRAQHVSGLQRRMSVQASPLSNPADSGAAAIDPAGLDVAPAQQRGKSISGRTLKGP